MSPAVEKIKQQLDKLKEEEERQEVFDHLMRVSYSLHYHPRDGKSSFTKSLDGAEPDHYTFGPLTIHVETRQ